MDPRGRLFPRGSHGRCPCPEQRAQPAPQFLVRDPRPAIAAAIALQSASSLPAANTGYAVSIGYGIVPVTPDAQAAAIARHYLDQQTSELAAPQLHSAPTVISETAVLARTAASLEPGLPGAALAARPDRVLWVVKVEGDFLDLHDLPWSTSAAPGPEGEIVIDDASGTILGVYPHVPGG
ncbi:MAG: hypothetical protein EPN50_08510 [Chloroflexota bacterium]|nr:MAG: hypothetical protein EPN50_08510 [Chloroflexota bacterium]